MSFNDFNEVLHDMITMEIKSYLKNEYIFRGISGIIKKKNEDGTYSVDIITTVLDNIKNKTNIELSVGDSVTLLEKIGSNYSNCFIFIKNG